MTIPTQTLYEQLREDVAHLTDMTEAGCVLRWQEEAQPHFELLCKNVPPEQVKMLDRLLTEAYRKASATS